MKFECPGTANIKTPVLEIRQCPECGEDVEVFSTDKKVNCPKCGFTIFNDFSSCLSYCKYAKECIGDELYRTLKEEKDE